MNDKVIINKADNVGVALTDDGNIPAGHKYALADIKKGEPVVKYGEIIGRATADIKAGEWVHTHNVRSHLDETPVYTYEYSAGIKKNGREIYFKGYPRAKGRAGIRNEIYIIPTVGCVNNVCIRIEKLAQKYVGGSIDGIFALTHQFGCSQLGEDNENIKKLFREQYVGGKEELQMDYSETDDPLSAGVEIVACPPGKKLTKISLLSGGERALTAIAILFAILMLRPMPFCVLDEIEAALDEANVDKFAQFLKKFAKETQFIVITHRKPTMEKADCLFGVTMEEKGVSKIVSVKLSEVESKLGGDTVA